jgi:hypothetical protein
MCAGLGYERAVPDPGATHDENLVPSRDVLLLDARVVIDEEAGRSICGELLAKPLEV